MRCNPSRWLWGLIPIAMLGWATYHLKQPRIEADLAVRATEALRKAGQSWAKVSLDGRDATITGLAETDGAPKAAFDIVRGVWGIRTVQLKTDLAGGSFGGERIGPQKRSEDAGARIAEEKARAEAEASRRAREQTQAAIEAQRDAERAALAAEQAEAARRAQQAAAEEEALRRQAEAEARVAAQRAREREEAEAEAEAVRKAREAAEADARAAALKAQQEAEAEAAREAEARRVAEEKARLAAEEAEARARKTTEATKACERRLADAADKGVILFSRAKADIDAESALTLARLAEIINACPGSRVEIEGHTDSEGTDERNQVLSERRAHAVVDSLVQAGVAKERLSAVGRGALRPAVSNDTPDGMARNRRIEFKVFVD